MKYIAMMVAGTLCAVSSVKAETFDGGMYATFEAKLSTDAKGHVYIDSSQNVVKADGKTFKINHIPAIDTGDPAYKKLKAEAKQGLTVTVDGLFQTKGPGTPLEFIIANANGKR
jgi:hypothetical protein